MSEVISGIQSLSGPADLNRLRGKLDLPKGFPILRYAGKWVKKGTGVDKARQPQILTGVGMVAEGWQPYKDSKKQLHVRTLDSGTYVLMIRPRAIQNAVNKLFGNVSKKRMAMEANGQTVAGEQNLDYGVLDTQKLNQIAAFRQDGMDETKVEMNKIDEAELKAASSLQ